MTGSPTSVDPVAWGRFLVAVFDEWVRHDVGEVFVSHFDAALASWAASPGAVHLRGDLRGRRSPRAQRRPVLVRPLRRARHLLGNIAQTHMVELWPLPSSGPSARPSGTPCPGTAGVLGPVRLQRGVPEEPVHVYARRRTRAQLPVPGYKTFFTHIHGPMRLMAELLRRPLRRRGRRPGPGRPQRPVSVRERTESQALPPVVTPSSGEIHIRGWPGGSLSGILVTDRDRCQATPWPRSAMGST